jgi:hypothetical protein
MSKESAHPDAPSLEFPLRHLSIRVPWHDAAWAGLVCKAPSLNAACVKLKGIAERKNEKRLDAIAGRRLHDLPEDQWPPCVDERGAFMAPFETIQIRKHALAAKSPKHYGHFKPTPQRFPAFSAGVVPFRWMMRENMEGYAENLELEVDRNREPDLGYESNWVHEAENQTALLNGFAGHLRPTDSLYLAYAKHVPFFESTGRILMGVGRITQIGELIEYQYSGTGMRGMVWERPIQHSIRPKSEDGFLFPYFKLFEAAQQDPSLNLEDFTPQVSDDHWDEFSYGSELVSHDGAISALLELDRRLSSVESGLGISTASEREWISTELVRLWTVRGPSPGLGAVLNAFGLSRGIFVAHALQEIAGVNADPWPIVEALFSNSPPKLPGHLLKDVKELIPVWAGLAKQRRRYLRLLSRFEMSADQARAYYEEGSRLEEGWDVTDRDAIGNPYRLFEATRRHPLGLRLASIDRGIFPDDTVRLKHPLESPSQLESGLDQRRLRAFAVQALERAADTGHTLLPQNEAVEAMSSLAVKPGLPLTGDILGTAARSMSPEVIALDEDGVIQIQLARYRDIGNSVRKQVEGRLSGKRNNVTADWQSLVNQKFGPISDDDEQNARSEKVAALKELAESRFALLAGPAGAGKTSLLAILCSQPAIQSDSVLMLAPTGKARVRLQELAGQGHAKAYTIAQFLNEYGRYNVVTSEYCISDRPKASGFGTVIVDEASMLTEDMTGALFDALQGVKRFIFVGDPAQLPPIGAGRPFVDLISKLRPDNYESVFPRVAPGYAELTIERRQIGADRPDLRFARWFGNGAPAPGDDDLFVADFSTDSKISFVEWKDADDFQHQIVRVLQSELQLSDPTDVRTFNRKLGATSKGDYDYFNATRENSPGSVKAVEAWQILSPLRGLPFGVASINRQIHERFRAKTMEFASLRLRSIPKPIGAERIVYGDKVINLRNHRRGGKRVWPKEGALGYLANGEIGIATGQFKLKSNPGILHVEFSSQPGFTYSFSGKDFTEEGDPALELAYALTVHKAQGSQFKLVIIIVPEGHPILSRELLYTALTRHQDRVVVLHQGPRTQLKQLAAPYESETARRMTNLMQSCKMVEVQLANRSVFLQAGLIHRTSTGIAVRSKSELIIAEALSRAGVAFEYERPLMLSGKTRYPDFTIQDDISGKTVYWEHLGMLERADYRSGWEKKLAWYQANQVLPAKDGGGANGTLIITTDSTKSGFNISEIEKIIQREL